MQMLREVNLLSILLRLAIAVLIGGLLGTERGLKNRPAGMRTYILVCMGSAIVMMTNQYAFQIWNISDPVRMGAQVVSGIGFLGAGTILKGRKAHRVQGLTTAAGIWLTAAIGVAAGLGRETTAIVSTLLAHLFMVCSIFILDKTRVLRLVM